MDKMNAQRREKRKNETPEEKQKRYEGQLDWNKRNPDKITEYRDKNKEVVKENAKKWAKENPEKVAIKHKRYRDKNPDRFREITKKSYLKNRDGLLEKRRVTTTKRKIEDPVFKFSENLRVLIIESFKKNKFKKSSKTENILGCTVSYFVDYILNLCPEGITLKDFGRFGYHIDHKIPISSAKNIEEVIKLSHYTNLQPLWWRDNIQKSNKLIL